MEMKKIRFAAAMFSLMALLGTIAVAQTADMKSFAKDGLSFDYPAGWNVQDESTSDAQQLTLSRTDSDAQIRLLVHRGNVKAENLPDAKKAFIDPYISYLNKQFESIGATPKQTPDASEIGGVKAEGVNMTASIGGEPGAARIYWALVGQRVAMLTYFGPDKDLKKFLPAWDLVRTSIKTSSVQAIPKPSPKP
jgi:hypothetical protein